MGCCGQAAGKPPAVRHRRPGCRLGGLAQLAFIVHYHINFVYFLSDHGKFLL